MNIEYLGAAWREMVSASMFYEGEAAGLGKRFLDDIDSIVHLIREHPDSGHEIGRFRHLVLRKFPYSVIYKRTGTDVLIVAVANQRRRPGYWKDRVE